MTGAQGRRAGDVREVALTFDCVGTPAVAILHKPPMPAAVGVVIVVGGPQYRVGGHRQFVELARALASAGFAVCRFDYRGIGDSPAQHPGFPNIAPDIEAGLAAFRAGVPEVAQVVLWALCDGVPAAADVAARTPYVAGIAAVNPWIREPETHDRTLLRHYYLKRPLQRDFWTNLLGGRLHARDFLRLAGRALRRAATHPPRKAAGPSAGDGQGSLPARLVADLSRIQGGVLVLLSGQDLTAREFEAAVRSLPAWQRLTRAPGFRITHLPDADHTCAGTHAHRASVRATLDWLSGLPDGPASASVARCPAPDAGSPDAEVMSR